MVTKREDDNIEEGQGQAGSRPLRGVANPFDVCRLPDNVKTPHSGRPKRGISDYEF